MAWKITDYNLNTMHKKSAQSVSKEYERLKGIVSKRIGTFERHGKQSLPQVRGISETIKGNDTRRQQERAIMEMRRFLSLKESSYTGHIRKVRSTIEYWKDFGVTGLTTGNIDKFLDFLSWAKSFMGTKYRSSSIAEAWEEANGEIEAAMEIYESMIEDGL